MKRVLNFTNPCLCSKCHGCIQLGRPNCSLNCDDCKEPALIGCPGFFDKVRDEGEFWEMVDGYDAYRDEMNKQAQRRYRMRE
jgi:hypothetical protein